MTHPGFVQSGHLQVGGSILTFDPMHVRCGSDSCLQQVHGVRGTNNDHFSP